MQNKLNKNVDYFCINLSSLLRINNSDFLLRVIFLSAGAVQHFQMQLVFLCDIPPGIPWIFFAHYKAFYACLVHALYYGSMYMYSV